MKVQYLELKSNAHWNIKIFNQKVANEPKLEFMIQQNCGPI